MSKRALWLAFGALSLGFVVASCTGSDGTANFDATGGDGAAGDDANAAGSGNGGTPNTGGSSAQAGADQGEGGSSFTGGGQGSGEAGAPAGGASSNAGQPGGGGDTTSAGAPAGDAGAGGDAVGGAGGSGPGRTPCESVKHCEEGQVCVKAACDKQEDGVGVCADAPTTPVCGCDGVTYYDGALAAEAGQDVRANGACKGDTAVTCDGECKEGLTCGIVELRDGDCNAKAGGVCWQLPTQCPALDLTLYNLCGSEKCLSLCEAVQEGVHAVPGGLACPVLN